MVASTTNRPSADSVMEQPLDLLQAPERYRREEKDRKSVGGPPAKGYVLRVIPLHANEWLDRGRKAECDL
jgi:hypothetical protein